MAERIIRQLIDDLDGTEIADASGERVIFSVRGTTYQLDLSATNAAKLDRALKPFIDAAVKAHRKPDPRPKKPSALEYLEKTLLREVVGKGAE